MRTENSLNTHTHTQTGSLEEISCPPPLPTYKEQKQLSTTLLSRSETTQPKGYGFAD